MQKQFLLVLIFIIPKLTFGCDCYIPKPIFEFESAEYVFEGNVISKVYTKDSLTYTVTFDITKHYKESNNPKTLEFTFKSERKYIEKWSSCDWSIKKNESWLVYAKYSDRKLTYNYYCSNSKPLSKRSISTNEQKILDNGNSFKLEDYILQFRTKPISAIDSIFKSGKIKNYKKPFASLILFIDKKGNLISVTTHNSYQPITDSIFNLPTKFKIKLREPLTEFEKDAIELLKRVSKWEIKEHKKTNISVSYIRHLRIEFDKEEKEWKYEL